jgi:hypothetical protein
VCDRWDSDKALDATPFSGTTGHYFPSQFYWLEIERSGTSISFRWSLDGEEFILLGTSTEAATGATMNEIGFSMMCETSSGVMVIRDFRRVA